MPSRSAKPAPLPSRAEIVADVQAVAVEAWAEIAPAAQLKAEPKGPVYYTAQAWAEANGMTRCTAQRQLDALVGGDKAKLVSELYRVKGCRQQQRVYWPVGVPAPDKA